MIYINSRSKKRRKSGFEEKINKIFKERFSVSLKKNNSKGKDGYMKTGVHIGGYSITKSKSPTSYSHDKGDLNSIKTINIVNNKKIKQNYLMAINNKYINQKIGNYNYNISNNNNNLNLIKTFNNNINNNINNLNQKPVITPMNKNNLSKKMSIGFPVNFSNVKRKILSKEKNRNNNNINNIHNIINNIGISNKFNNNKVEFLSTHNSKEKNYGSIKSNSINKKNHRGSKNKSIKTKNNFININSINLNSKSKSKTKRGAINMKK
jgi:hypothetical protein